MQSRWIAALGVAVIAACAPDEGAEQYAEPPEPPAAAAPAALGAAMPDTTAASLWAHLQGADYRAWQLWPGKGELYEGTEPHGMLLTTYVNALALGALATGVPTLPAGAIVVKENYMPDRTLAAVTVMYKVPGYAPDAGDWFWAKYLPDNSVEASGRVPMCQACHSANAAADYLLTPLPG